MRTWFQLSSYFRKQAGRIPYLYYYWWFGHFGGFGVAKVVTAGAYFVCLPKVTLASLTRLTRLAGSPVRYLVLGVGPPRCTTISRYIALPGLSHEALCTIVVSYSRTMSEGSLVAEADALRSEFEALLDLLQGGESAVEFRGYEANVAAIHGRATLLKQAFARARMQEVMATQETAEEDEEKLRAEITALEREVQVKDNLLAAHSERLARWKVECDSVHRNAMELLQINSREGTPPPGEGTAIT